MKFCLETAKDLGKYFQGSFVKFKGMQGVFSDGTECAPADELVHSFDQISGAMIKGKRFENGETVPYQFLLYSEHSHTAPEIEFILPKKSFFNTDMGAMLLQRIPARQYRRGICGDNTSIHLLRANGVWQSQPVTFELLDKYVRKPSFIGFHESEVSYAVSRRVAVDAKSNVWVDQQAVGTINYPQKRVAVLPLFAPEMQAILRACGQDDWSVSLPESPKSKVVKKSVPAQSLFTE